MKKLVGKCGNCGGRVFIPTIWHGVNPPHPQCESCGCVASDTAHLPTLPMRKKQAAVTMVRRETQTGDGWPVSSEDMCGGASTVRTLRGDSFLGGQKITQRTWW